MDPNLPQPVQTSRKKIPGRTKVALLLLIGPTMLLAFAILLFAITNFIAGNAAESVPASCDTSQLSIADGTGTARGECDVDLFGKQPVAVSTLNALIFLLGSVGALTWLPGLIIGLVLLTTKPKNTQTPIQ